MGLKHFKKLQMDKERNKKGQLKIFFNKKRPHPAMTHETQEKQYKGESL